VGRARDERVQSVRRGAHRARRRVVERRRPDDGRAYGRRATEPDRERLTAAFDRLVAVYAGEQRGGRAEEGDADARFHLAIAEASHNAVLLHTIRSLFDLLKRNVVTNIGGMYPKSSEVRGMLMRQHTDLYRAIIEGRAEDARNCACDHLDYVQQVLAEAQLEETRVARARRRQALA